MLCIENPTHIVAWEPISISYLGNWLAQLCPGGTVDQDVPNAVQVHFGCNYYVIWWIFDPCKVST